HAAQRASSGVELGCDDGTEIGTRSEPREPLEVAARVGLGAKHAEVDIRVKEDVAGDFQTRPPPPCPCLQLRGWLLRLADRTRLDRAPCRSLPSRSSRRGSLGLSGASPGQSGYSSFWCRPKPCQVPPVSRIHCIQPKDNG